MGSEMMFLHYLFMYDKKYYYLTNITHLFFQVPRFLNNRRKNAGKLRKSIIGASFHGI